MPRSLRKAGKLILLGYESSCVECRCCIKALHVPQLHTAIEPLGSIIHCQSSASEICMWQDLVHHQACHQAQSQPQPQTNDIWTSCCMQHLLTQLRHHKHVLLTQLQHHSHAITRQPYSPVTHLNSITRHLKCSQTVPYLICNICMSFSESAGFA